MISAKLLLLIQKWVFESFSYRFDGPSKTLLFYFSLFGFDDFLTTFAKSLTKRPPICMIEIKSLYKLLLCQKDLRSRNFLQWIDGSLNVFKNFYGNEFSLLVFIKQQNHCICHLMTHIRCIAVICFNENWSSLEQPFWNNGPSIMVSNFFRFFTFSCLCGIFVENCMENWLFWK